MTAPCIHVIKGEWELKSYHELVILAYWNSLIFDWVIWYTVLTGDTQRWNLEVQTNCQIQVFFPWQQLDQDKANNLGCWKSVIIASKQLLLASELICT